MDEEKYKPPFIDRFLEFITYKFYYAFLITMSICIILVFFNRVAAIIIMGFCCILLYLLMYFIYNVYNRYREKKIDKEYKVDLDISKYFDNVKYDLYNDEDVEEFKKQ